MVENNETKESDTFGLRQVQHIKSLMVDEGNWLVKERLKEWDTSKKKLAKVLFLYKTLGLFLSLSGENAQAIGNVPLYHL